MNVRQKVATALAATTLAVVPASATTVAWYHFNEGESGEVAAGGQAVIQNAVDPTSLAGTPVQMGSGSGEGMIGSSGRLPVYTNDTGISWYDPVTGARGTDSRSIFLPSNGGLGSRPAAAVRVDNDVKLHCANITVELMVKIPPEITITAGSWIHLIMMRTSPDSESTANKKAWGIMIRGTTSLIVYAQDYTGATNPLNSNGYYYSNNANIADGKWHHVALTYDGEKLKVYVDYVEKGSANCAGLIYNNDAGKLCIGGNDQNNYGNWPGFIDEVRISNEALTPDKFLRTYELSGIQASDDDTAIYLPFNSTDFNYASLNSACSTNAELIGVSLSTITAGIYPRLDTGVSAVSTNVLHAGILATNAIANEGCWTYTNNLMGTAYAGKARHILIDDFSKNNNTHLITSGDFTAELYLKLLETPTIVTRILCENSGSKTTGTLDFRVDGSNLTAHLVPQSELDAFDSGTATSVTGIDLSVPVAGLVGEWHHVALVVDRAHQTAKLYVDGNLAASQGNFLLASKVSTYSDGYKPLKIGDGWGGNNQMGFQNMSIDEFRITRRALASQEFLMAGAPVDAAALASTRAWIDFEDDLEVKPAAGMIPSGEASAEFTYSSDVPGVAGGEILDGNKRFIREANNVSMKFSGATSASAGTRRVYFDRNILLERDMQSQTVEFFMKGARDQAVAWSYILRMYNIPTSSQPANNGGERMWSIGYRDTNGALYVGIDNGSGRSDWQTKYPDNSVSFADGRWHHVAVTFEPDGSGNTRCKVYKDYVQVGTDLSFSGLLFTYDGQPINFSDSSLGVGLKYNGLLDEIRISKGVLPVSQMLYVRKKGTAICIR